MGVKTSNKVTTHLQRPLVACMTAHQAKFRMFSPSELEKYLSTILRAPIIFNLRREEECRIVWWLSSTFRPRNCNRTHRLRAKTCTWGEDWTQLTTSSMLRLSSLRAPMLTATPAKHSSTSQETLWKSTAKMSWKSWSKRFSRLTRSITATISSPCLLWTVSLMGLMRILSQKQKTSNFTGKFIFWIEIFT